MGRSTKDALTAVLVIIGTLTVCEGVWVAMGGDDGQTSFRETAPRQSDALWRLLSREQ